MAEKMLTEQMLTILARTYVMAYHAQVAHWNTMGPDFLVTHKFFGDVYAELSAAVDVIAESLRTLREFPSDRLIDLVALAGGERYTSAQNTFKRLSEDNEDLLAALRLAYDATTASAEYLGVGNHLQDRLSAHDKLGWMLRASMSK